MNKSGFQYVAWTFVVNIASQCSVATATVPCIGSTAKRPSLFESTPKFTSFYQPTDDCIIDIGPHINVTTDPYTAAVVYLAVGCRKRTDISLVNRSNVTRKDIITYFMLQGPCQTSLQDIARFSNASDLRVLLMIRGAKIRMKHSNQHVIDVKSMRNLGTLAFESSSETGIHSIFLDYKWPLLAEVEFVNLSIKTFPDKLKHSMPHLQDMQLNNNSLETPPDFPWDHEFLNLPRNLTRKSAFNEQYEEGTVVQPNLYRRFLMLEFNRIQNLSLHQFRGYLQKLSLKGNSLHTIGPNCFKNVTGLNIIDLSINKLKELPKRVFRGLYYLLGIRLDRNQISVIPEDIFIDCTKIKRLYLNDNQIKVIPKKLLAKHEELEEIHFENNAISHVMNGALPNNSNKLRKLFLQNNVLTSPPDAVFCIRSLKRAYMASNRITFQGILNTLDAISLQYLGNYCLRESVSSLQYKLRSVSTYLDIANNNITSLDINKLGKEQRVKLKMILVVFEMNLKNNPIRCDCKTLDIKRLIKKIISKNSNVKEDRFHSWICDTPPELKGKRLLDVSDRALLCIENGLPGCPKVSKCLVRGVDGTIIIIAQHKHLKQLPQEMPAGNELEIHLDNNEIVELSMRRYLSNVTVLHLSRNKIQHLNDSFIVHLTKLRELKLDSNDLKRLPRSIVTLTSRKSFVSLAIHNNYLLCDCHAKWIPAWLKNVSNKIEDIENVKCASGKLLGKPIYKTPLEDFKCEKETTAGAEVKQVHIILSIVLGTILGITIIVFVLIHFFKGEMKVFLYTHFNWHPFDRVDDQDPAKIYDAFISYSSHDRSWVFQELRTKLEGHSPPYKICFHDRDFEVGATIYDNILNCVNQSRRMIIVLSNSFLQSEWCRFEFRAAHQKVLEDKTNYLIIILFDDVDSQSLDKETRLYLRTNTYLSVSNKWFWEKLSYALPQPRQEAQLTREEINELTSRQTEYLESDIKTDTSL